MNRDFIKKEYLKWLCELICENPYKREQYSRLLAHLYYTEFVYLLAMDGNRAEDGMNLRYRFAREKKYYSDAAVASCLDDRPCSVLEMMIALAIRCEKDIMDDPEYGDRTEKWFWQMISSLSLRNMTNDYFEPSKFDQIMDAFINRKYSRDGRGGLFTVKNCKHDMRRAEIWYQMSWYLDSLL